MCIVWARTQTVDLASQARSHLLPADLWNHAVFPACDARWNFTSAKHGQSDLALFVGTTTRSKNSHLVRGELKTEMPKPDRNVHNNLSRPMTSHIQGGLGPNTAVGEPSSAASRPQGLHQQHENCWDFIAPSRLLIVPDRRVHAAWWRTFSVIPSKSQEMHQQCFSRSLPVPQRNDIQTYSHDAARMFIAEDPDVGLP